MNTTCLKSCNSGAKYKDTKYAFLEEKNYAAFSKDDISHYIFYNQAPKALIYLMCQNMTEFIIIS